MSRGFLFVCIQWYSVYAFQPNTILFELKKILVDIERHTEDGNLTKMLVFICALDTVRECSLQQLNHN